MMSFAQRFYKIQLMLCFEEVSSLCCEAIFMASSPNFAYDMTSPVLVTGFVSRPSLGDGCHLQRGQALL